MSGSFFKINNPKEICDYLDEALYFTCFSHFLKEQLCFIVVDIKINSFPHDDISFIKGVKELDNLFEYRFKPSILIKARLISESTQTNENRFINKIKNTHFFHGGCYIDSISKNTVSSNTNSVSFYLRLLDDKKEWISNSYLYENIDFFSNDLDKIKNFVKETNQQILTSFEILGSYLENNVKEKLI